MDFSVKRAAVYSGLSFAFMGAAKGTYGLWHHAQGAFDSLNAVFSYVAEPKAALVAAGAAIVIGAGYEAINRYHKQLDKEDLTRGRQPGPTPPRK